MFFDGTSPAVLIISANCGHGALAHTLTLFPSTQSGQGQNLSGLENMAAHRVKRQSVNWLKLMVNFPPGDKSAEKPKSQLVQP